jgi:hypothetical protein
MTTTLVAAITITCERFSIPSISVSNYSKTLSWTSVDSDLEEAIASISSKNRIEGEYSRALLNKDLIAFS